MTKNGEYRIIENKAKRKFSIEVFEENGWVECLHLIYNHQDETNIYSLTREPVFDSIKKLFKQYINIRESKDSSKNIIVFTEDDLKKEMKDV